MIYLLKPDGSIEQPTHVGQPNLDTLHKWIGGHIELVPYWTRWLKRAPFEWEPCQAFCNEDGKGMNLPVNPFATAMWRKVQGLHPIPDFLVGTIVVLTGEHMVD